MCTAAPQPFCLRLSLSLQVHYETLPGWKEDISSVRSFSELPVAAQKYVQRIEELLGVPCKYIRVGPGRDALIIKDQTLNCGAPI